MVHGRPDGYWLPSEIDWDFAQLLALQRICQKRQLLRKFQFGRLQANLALPGAYENAAEDARRQMKRKQQEGDGPMAIQD